MQGRLDKNETQMKDNLVNQMKKTFQKEVQFIFKLCQFV